MQRDFTSYLFDLLDAGEAIESYAHGLTQETYAEDSRTQAAVERKFEVMGEALVQARRLYPAEVSALGEIQPIVDFRNFLVHEYHRIQAPVVWRIIRGDLPIVMRSVRELLGSRATHE